MSEYLTPDQIIGASFETKRKGIDPDGVKQHLAAVAQTVRGLQDERAALEAQIEELQSEIARTPAEPAPQVEVELDEDELTERLGQDAARILAEARATAADRIAEAEAEAANITAAAEEIYAKRSAEADVEAQRIRATAEGVVEEKRLEAGRQAAQILAEAETKAEKTLSVVKSERQVADADADRLVREAELTRRQILEDLARRRSSARRQIEQLRAGRERLMASHETVRRALDEIGEELAISMSEARAAAETAGHTVSDTTIEELEAEIETARLTGLLDTGPVPVVQQSVVGEPEPEPVQAAEPEPVKAAEPEPDTPDTEEEGSAEMAEAPVEPTEDSSPTEEASDDASDEPSASEINADDESEDSESGVSESEEGDAGDADLTNVVQLDAARVEVDTASHPATGRGATNRTAEPPSSPALPSKKVSEAKDAKRAKHPAGSGATVTQLGAAKVAPTEDSDAEDTVDDLFASLRSVTEEPAKKAPAKKAKKTAAKKPKKKAKATTPKKKAEPKVDSSELARRLKRVLADEQSKAMSTVKAGDSVPSLDELLGEFDDHCAAYWAAATDEIPSGSQSESRASIDALVKGIRRRVGDGLEGAGDDKEAAVASLRSVYREIKTQRVGEAADAAMGA